MMIVLFGVSNVGKTTTARNLAKLLGYQFVDVDESIRKRYEISMEEFQNQFPYRNERDRIRGEVLREEIWRGKDQMVIAMSPIYYYRSIAPVMRLPGLVPIELQDTKEHIFDRMVFSDENDVTYKDDAYKILHKAHYIKEIHQDIMDAKKMFKKVERKYFINNKSVDEVADDLMMLIEKLSGGKQPSS